MKDLTQPTLGGWLVHVLREADSALSFEEALHAILDSMKLYFPAQSAAVVLIDEDTKEMRIKISRQLSYSFAKEFRKKAPGPHIERMVLEQAPLLLGDAESAPALSAEVRLEHAFTSAVLAPIVKNHRGIGYLFCDRSGPPPFGESDLLHLQVLGFLIGSLMVKFELLQERRMLSHVDDASGALKYVAFVPALARELHRSITHDFPVALALMQLPAFRHLLDTYGIDRAHEALAALVKLAQARIREEDLLARYGADQFIVCLSGTDEAAARGVLEAIQAEARKTVASDTAISAALTVGGLVLASDGAKKRPLQDLMGLCGKALVAATADGPGSLRLERV
jgi:diguanylate cyclase (GGDEF)-like protein